MPPIIGISRCNRLTDYVESIRRAGGEPRILDPATDDASRALDEVDGLLLTGGGDVDPTRYGEPRHDSVEPAEPGRDEFEMKLAATALERDRPLLAICRGMQVLNVAAGGSLVQDIPTMLDGALNHSVKEPAAGVAHPVWVAPDSRLSEILREHLDASGECGVNSRHHQAVKRVADGFRVSATAPDGVIEAMERPQARFCVGVEWHPENFWRTGEFRALFEAFLTACQNSE